MKNDRGEHPKARPSRATITVVSNGAIVDWQHPGTEAIPPMPASAVFASVDEGVLFVRDLLTGALAWPRRP